MSNVRIILLFLGMSMIGNLSAGWSSVYHQKISPKESAKAEERDQLLFAKEQVPMFTQLLPSWNALRPAKGYFTFCVQARDAHTQKWGAWHKIADWGSDIQRSYASKSDGFTKFVHVRLETEPLQLADGFKIKVVASKGASLKDIKGLAVTVADMRNFSSEPASASLKLLPSVYLKEVPKISQLALNVPDSSRICSPVSCSMITQYLMKKPVSPTLFAKQSYDKGLDAYGSWACNMAHAFERCKGKYWFFNTRLNSFSDVHKQLLRGLPVAVSVRGALKGAPKSFPNGHLLVVVGWDKETKEVLCHDPSLEQHHEVLKRYKIDDFLKSWEQSHRLAYWVEPV